MTRTLENIAKDLGVSRRSISRFINGKGYLSKTSKEKIARYLKKETYYPNVLGARLATQRVPVLGIVFPQYEKQDGGYFIFSTMQGVWASAIRQGMQVMQFSQSPFRLEESLRIVKSKLAGGLLFVSPNASEGSLFPALKREGVPAVSLNARMPQVDCFVCENRWGAREAVRHLIAQGCERIVFLHGQVGWYDADERFAGYREALEEAGKPFSKEGVEFGHFSMEGGERGATTFLERNPRPDAIFAGNDLMAIGAVRAIQKKGLKIPQDIQVMGFDDIPYCRLPILQPTISSVAQPFSAMAEAATSRLAELIQGVRGSKGGETFLFKPTLMLRGSTRPG